MNEKSARHRTVTVALDAAMPTSGVIEVHIVGDGPAVVLIPSAGRWSTDSLVTIENAGHALLPEQPELVATCIISWLEDQLDQPLGTD